MCDPEHHRTAAGHTEDVFNHRSLDGTAVQDRRGQQSTPGPGPGGDYSPHTQVLEETAVVFPQAQGQSHTHRSRRDLPLPGSADRFQRWNTRLDAGEPTQTSTSSRDVLS